jgi:Family of unknown function (DUF5335)
MTTKPTQAGPSGPGATIEIESGRWSAWCVETTAVLAGRDLDLSFADRGIGEVQLADGMHFVAIEYDELGPAVAFTIKYGDGALPVRHVIAEPQDVRQRHDRDGAIESVTIEDKTGRRTLIVVA